MPQLLQCHCQGAFRDGRRCTWRAGRRLSTPPLAISLTAPISPVCAGLLTGPAVCLWLEDGGVTLAEPMLRLASDVLWVQRGAEPREAKNQQNMAFHVHRIHVFLQDPMSRDPSGIKQNQTHTNTIPHLSLPYHFQKESEKW